MALGDFSLKGQQLLFNLECVSSLKNTLIKKKGQIKLNRLLKTLTLKSNACVVSSEGFKKSRTYCGQ